MKQSEVVVVGAGAVKARLNKPSKRVKLKVAEMLSYTPEGSPGITMDKRSFYSFRDDTFPAGFVRLVTRRLKMQGYRVVVRFKAEPPAIGEDRATVDSFDPNPEYDYQFDAVDRLVQLRRGIAQVATGGGKSRIFKLAERRVGRPTLFLTTRKSLMYQMMEDYQKTINKDVGCLGDGHWSMKADGCNFAIIDTLADRLRGFDVEAAADMEAQKHVDLIEEKVVAELKRLSLPTAPRVRKNAPPEIRKEIDAVIGRIERENPMNEQKIADRLDARKKKSEQQKAELVEFLAHIEFVVLEEAHEVSSESFYRVMNACKNAHYRLGLTATPFMKDNEEANMRLMAVTGPIFIKVSEKQLIDAGILSTPKFRYAECSVKTVVSPRAKWQDAYKRGIVENQQRNRMVVAECLRAKEYGLTSMVLTLQTNHGKLLQELMEAKGLRVARLSGSHNAKARKRELVRLGSGDIDVLIGTTILDVGIDVPSVGLIVMAGGGKAEVAIRQRIGRGLRRKKSGPNISLVLDFLDEGHRNLQEHARQRQAIVKGTPGFAENVIQGQFNYELMGFKKEGSSVKIEFNEGEPPKFDGKQYLLRFGFNGLGKPVICSGEYRYGRPGEPSQDIMRWRSDCSRHANVLIGVVNWCQKVTERPIVVCVNSLGGSVCQKLSTEIFSYFCQLSLLQKASGQRVIIYLVSRLILPSLPCFQVRPLRLAKSLIPVKNPRYLSPMYHTNLTKVPLNSHRCTTHP